MNIATVEPIHIGSDMADIYRLDVFALEILDAVSLAGGWLFDRAMAGWKVTLVLPIPDHHSEFAARVLGAEVANYSSVAGMIRPCPYGVAAVGSAIGMGVVQSHIERGSESGGLELSLIGDIERISELHGYAFRHHLHRLSRAAIAFKSRSLATLGCDVVPMTSNTERLSSTFCDADGDGGTHRLLEPGDIAGARRPAEVDQH